jgi:hypothetical protein
MKMSEDYLGSLLNYEKSLREEVSKWEESAFPPKRKQALHCYHYALKKLYENFPLLGMIKTDDRYETVLDFDVSIDDCVRVCENDPEEGNRIIICDLNTGEIISEN